MKKIYISADVEGLNGVTSFNQVLPEFELEYSQMRPQLHLELNALLKGIQEAGIEEIIVNDAHNTMTNIILTNLPDNIKLISGKPKDISMMYGLDKTFDAVIFFAYHSKAQTDGVLSHTFNMNFKKVLLNGENVSEAQLNAIYAAKLGVPVVLASGDDAFCSQIRKDIGQITTIETKKTITRTASICRKNADLLFEYTSMGRKISTLPKILYKTLDQYELTVEFDNAQSAKAIAKQTSLDFYDNSVKFASNDYTEVYKTLQNISAVTTTALQKNQNQRV